MAIYVVRAGDLDVYKVGTAANPQKRLADLQTASPFHLTLVAVIEGDREVERRVHAALHTKRAHGEWFELDAPPTVDELTEWATFTPKEAPAPFPVRDPDCVCEPVGIVEVCARLRVTRAAYDQWQHRKLDFPAPRWTVGGRPAWDWPDVERWAIQTGRLSPARKRSAADRVGQPRRDPSPARSGRTD